MKYEMPTAIIELHRAKFPIEIPNILKVEKLLGGIGLCQYADNSLRFGYLGYGKLYLYSPRFNVYELEQYCSDHYAKYVEIAAFLVPKLKSNDLIDIIPFWEHSPSLAWLNCEKYSNLPFIALQQAYDLQQLLLNYGLLLSHSKIEDRLSLHITSSSDNKIAFPFHFELSNTEYSIKAIWHDLKPAKEYIHRTCGSVFPFYGYTAISQGKDIFTALECQMLASYIEYFIEGFQKFNFFRN